MINVPGTLTMDQCYVYGTRQGVIVRGGEATINNCYVYLKDWTNGENARLYEAGKDLYLNSNWGGGNEVPMAAVVVGNRNNAYAYPATCTMTDTYVEAPEGYNAIYAYGMDDVDNRAVTLSIGGENSYMNGTIVSENKAVTTVSGGIFTEDPSAFLPRGYKATYNSFADGYVVEQLAPFATVGEEKYYSLDEALKNAPEGSTITVQELDDTPTVTLVAPTNNNVTLDLNGQTMIVGNSESITISDGKSFTIKNGTFANCNNYANGVVPMFRIEKNSSMTLDGVEIYTNASILFPKGDAASVTVVNSTLVCGVYAVATNAASAENYNVVITLKDSYITGKGYNNDADACPIMINVPGTLNMDNCTVRSGRQAVLVRGGTANIKNCTLALTDVGGYGIYEKGKDWYLNGNWSSGDEVPMAAVVVGNRSNAYAYPATCTMTNTYVEAPDGYNAIYVYGMNDTDRAAKLNIDGTTAGVMGAIVNGEGSAASIAITGGEYSEDPSAFLPKGYEATFTDDTYIVEEAEPVAKIGAEVYYTLADAVAEAKSGDTITLMTSCEGDGIALLSADAKTITIDLNEHTYNVSGEPVGSKGTETQAFHFEKGNTITIKNGTLKTTSSDARMLIQNYSNLTLTDVVVDGANLSGDSGYVVSNNYGTTVLNGNTSIYTKDYRWFALDSCGAKGSWSGDTYAPGADVTIDTTGYIGGKLESCSKLTIKNGTFSSTITLATCITDPAPTAIVITGGEFLAKPNADFISEGCCVAESASSAVYVVSAHELVHHDAVAATTEAAGNVEYWSCERCGKLFSDAEGKNEVRLGDVTIGKLISVTVSSDKYPITINGSEKSTTTTEAYAQGAKVTVKAGSENFAYWSMGGVCVSTDPTYTFTVSTKMDLKAVYNTPVEAKTIVEWQSAYGQVMQRGQYGVNDTFTEPGVPSCLGYTANGWGMTVDQIKAEIAKGTPVVVVKPNYALDVCKFSITVENGSGSGTYTQNDVVTAKANAAEGGKKFSHWADADGNVLGYMETYKFYATQDYTIKAVYVDETEVVEAKGTADIVEVREDTTNNKISFVSMLTVPEGCTISYAGVVATSKASDSENLTAENAEYVRGTAAPGYSAYRYTWTKGKVTVDQTWYARAYLVYVDAQGVTQTVYGELVTASLSR